MNTINFMYFAHSYNGTQLQQIINALGNVSHFTNKYNDAKGENGTEKFLNWFMMLSIDNMLIVTKWIETNYKNL